VDSRLEYRNQNTKICFLLITGNADIIKEKEMIAMSVKAADIYREILETLEIGESAAESTTRNLRNKMTFLLEQVALRKVSDFKIGNNIYISNNDAPIVRNILMCSMDDDYPYIVDWFNGALDLDDSQTSILVYETIKEPILRALMTGETDEVTVDEWISSIRGLLNVDMAKNTLSMKKKLEDFRVRTLVKNNTINYGDIIVCQEDGSRGYAIKSEKEEKTISQELLEKIVEELEFQGDYFSVLNQIMDYMIADAEKKAIPGIETLALAKSLSDTETAIEMIKENNGSMVSEYYPWFQKVADFLNKHPNDAKRIEEFAHTDNLERFFLNK
jgi:hypothetical protein